MIILLRYMEGNGKSLALASNRQQREEVWSRSIAVGSAAFVQKTKELLGLRAKKRKVVLVGDAFMLREAQEPYGADFKASPECLRSHQRATIPNSAASFSHAGRLRLIMSSSKQ